MSIRYSTNWMGIANLRWYKERGLLTKRSLVRHGKYKPGDTLDVEEPTQRYSCGRIDVRGNNLGPYGTEIGVPPMTDLDWRRFGDWLITFETDDVWTLNQLVEMYERANPKITWWKE